MVILSSSKIVLTIIFRKFKRTNPLLVASITGTLCKWKKVPAEEASRKGFGGPCKQMDIDLAPAICQTVSRLLKNRHPKCISEIPCMNSLYFWTNKIPGQLFQLHNLLGDCFR